MGAPWCECGHSQRSHRKGKCRGEQVKFKPLRLGTCDCDHFKKAKGFF